MTLNGVGSRTRLGLPAGGSRLEPVSQAHRPRSDGVGAAAAALWAAAGCTGRSRSPRPAPPPRPRSA